MAENTLATSDTKIPQTLRQLAEEATQHAIEADAENTRRAYESAWSDFTAWAGEHGLEALPARPETVALYITDRAGRLAVSSLSMRLAAIRQQHVRRNLAVPTEHQTVRRVWTGIRRRKGTAQKGKAALQQDQLRRILDGCGEGLIGLRDRALLLTGFTSAMRRSEIVALNIEDLEIHPEGIIFHIRRSKEDQEGEGAEVAVPSGRDPAFCTQRAVQAWIGAAGLTEGPLFRSVNRHGQVADTALTGQSVALIVKKRVGDLGMPTDVFSGHSLRAGFLTAAFGKGVPLAQAMNHSRHKSPQVALRYYRRAKPFADNAAAAILGEE